MRAEALCLESLLHLADGLQTDEGVEQAVDSQDGSSGPGHPHRALPGGHALHVNIINIIKIIIIINIINIVNNPFPSPVGPMHMVAATGLL